jgi:hypothetical protein
MYHNSCVEMFVVEPMTATSSGGDSTAATRQNGERRVLGMRVYLIARDNLVPCRIV